MVQTTPRSTVEAAVQPIRRRRSAWPWPLNLYQTYVGKKWVMAITGVMLMGFVAFHMFGNLKIYLGAAELDHYAEGLREALYPIMPRMFPLWVLRIGLLGAFVLHMHASFAIWRLNRAARPVGYQSKRDYIAADWASRTMRWTGPIVLLFVVFHLADLTWGVEAVNPEFQRGAVYQNVTYSLSRWPVALIYIVANLALGVHLWHGAWSMFQSLGVNNPHINRLRRPFAVLFTVVVIGANLSFPIAILTGIVD